MACCSDETVSSDVMGEHLKTPEDVKTFPKFPEGTTSLLSKCLTQEVWDKLKDAKDEKGFTLQRAIFSGCKWTSSGVGVYAGSASSYQAFAPLFDEIIHQYHGFKKGTDKHVVDMDTSKLNCPPFPEDEAAMIKSTRIRVARNLKGYPLGTCVSTEERKEIEEKVTKVLTADDFPEHLKGKYYSLESMSDDDRKQLIEDHFLFKGNDKYLIAAGLENDWPKNRGIFHNAEKNFLVWVNEEDQLRIISMQQGSDIGAVFKRLAEAADLIEKSAGFQIDENYGYVATCPTNMGTGMRASVHIHLPNLAKDKAGMEEIAAKFHVQVRGIHGEHTETDDGIFDISNKRRLGRNEVQLVQDMYDGVKAMIAKEKELAKKE